MTRRKIVEKWGLEDEEGNIVERFRNKDCAVEWQSSLGKKLLKRLKVVKLSLEKLK
jgi:hypothetical protein